MVALLARKTALLVLFALMLSMGSALGTELIGDCDDCCEEATCTDCLFCWCCCAVPPAITPVSPTQTVIFESDIIEFAVEQNFESLSLDLLDPPPRS